MLLGRGRECESLDRLIDTIRSGESRALVLRGEAGVGKTALLDYLLAHGHRPEFTCRFRWQNGSVAFWDNRAVKHLAIHDAGPYLRVMRRVQIAGDRPYE